MSSEARPISPARFAEAIKEMPESSIAMKLAELRQSIAQLDYSNEELRPYAEGRKRAISQQESSSNSSDANSTTKSESTEQEDQSSPSFELDPDCAEAIIENNAVIARMQHRIELIRTEVEGRGLNWDEFQHILRQAPPPRRPEQENEPSTNDTNSTDAAAAGGQTQNGEGQHEAWRDGTFQTGTLSGLLTEEELIDQLMSRLGPNGDGNNSSSHNPGPDGGIDL